MFVLLFVYVLQVPHLHFALDDFFVGIGDINSDFLPKIQPLAPALPPTPGKPTFLRSSCSC